jgi:MFS transporter, SHS family, sialic acid transporter
MQLGGEAAPHAKEYSQIATALGAIVATYAAALFADRVGRRPTFALMCLATITAALWLYQGHKEFGASFLLAAFLAGGASASFYGLFPLYFPELFPTAVRATGQGFALNFGRIIAAVGGLQTATLMNFFGGSFPKAGSVLVAIYLVGVVIVWLGPETKGRPLPD